MPKKLQVWSHGTIKEKKEIRAWMKSRPKKIRSMIRLNPPSYKYLMILTGEDFYTIRSYCENGTLKVDRFCSRTNQYLHTVFNVNPDELIPYEELEATIG